MLFYLETQSGLLSAFVSPRDAEAHLEVIDIENREFEFCDEVGQQFIGEVFHSESKPGRRSFRLVPKGAPSQRAIETLVSRAKQLDKRTLKSTSLEDLKYRFRPNQSTDPTLASGTPPARQESRHP
jgi:hypothetical protein